ncbi:unnamed protein product [Symbiodinium sp. CCMP2592]|nr:unnamed protein product [Symbiodinium sp. CCMP2592]
MNGAEQILTDEEWKRLLPQHRWDRTARPYKRTYGLRLSQVCRTRRPHEYTHPLGAIGMVVYREETRPEACNTEAVVQQTKLCPGRHEEACRFHRDGSGRPAGPSKHSKTGRCMFCDATALREVHRVAPSTITRALNNLKAKAAEVHRLARTRVQETLEAFSSVVSIEDRICHVALCDTEVQEAAKARDNDAKRARRKFPTLYEDEGQHGDWQTTAAKTFQKWAEEASWTTCPGCKRLRTQRFPAGSRRSKARCNHCAKGKGYVAPTPGDVPLALRGMSRVVLECLRPFSISCGPGERSPAGYWVHTAPIRFRWKSATLTERIAGLEVERERKHAQVASEWLLQNEESAYKKFNELQEVYVMASQQQEGAEETPSTNLMPLRFMETVGIECTVHVHVLVWLREDADKGRLPSLISAELPPAGTPLGDLVRGSQLDRHDSAWPRREEASIWDTVSQTLQLKHPRDAWEAKVRAYMPDVLGCLRCHMDVQASDGRGMILRYATGYISKFSQLWTLEGQLDKRDIAHSILWQYHPLEMEMVLQLASHILPQCTHTGHIRRFVVPVPWSSSRLPREIELYEKSTWRADTMPLLEFLRRSNSKGEISVDIRRRYEDEKPSCTLNEFANKCSTQGSTMVATVLYARSNDNFFKQWMLLNVPFRSLNDLWHATVDKIPEDLQGLALCLHHCPRYWQSMPAIRQEMEAEAWKDYHIENGISSVKAKTEMIQQVRAGNYEPLVATTCEQHVAALPNESELSAEQRHLVQAMTDLVIAAAEKRCGGTVAADQWNEHVQRGSHERAIGCLGAAGTGKSVAVKTVIKKVQDRANVAIACPTGLLAASYRRSFTGAHIDTVHGFFALHVEEHLTLDLLANYDFVVVEEIGQLTRTQFERIMRLWLAADQRPCLVFLGDFKQLPSIDNSNARASPLCKHVRWWELRQVQRSTCPELTRKLQLLRDRQPTHSQLQAILRGHSVSKGDRPTREEVAGVLESQREVTMVTFTRRAAEELNQMAVEIQFADHEPLRIVPTDPDANMDNKLRGEHVKYECSYTALHIGMKLMLTRNVNKEGDHVNGMFCHLEAVGRHGIRVRTATNRLSYS